MRLCCLNRLVKGGGVTWLFNEAMLFKQQLKGGGGYMGI